jgi:hypothetical protein
MRFRTPGNPEMIWHGRAHLGDEPGVYGDASYSGLAMEFPVTLTRFGDAREAANVTFELTAEGASSFGPPYQGHKVTVFALDEVADSDPAAWEKLLVGEGFLRQEPTRVSARIEDGVRYVTVRLEADLSVAPGYYDDVVLTDLAVLSYTHYADFGFRA